MASHRIETGPKPLLLLTLALLAGCEQEKTPQLQGPVVSDIRLDEVIRHSETASDPLIARVRNEIVGAKGRTIVKATVVEPADPPMSPGETVYVITEQVPSDPPGTEIELRYSPDGDDDLFTIDGKKVIVLEGNL